MHNGVVKLKVLHVDRCTRKNSLRINAIMGSPEYEQLKGESQSLCVFATSQIDLPTSSTKMGKNGKFCKYLLLPPKIRRQYTTKDYDFEKLKSGITEFKGKIYVIFEVPPNNHPSEPSENPIRE